MLNSIVSHGPCVANKLAIQIHKLKLVLDVINNGSGWGERAIVAFYNIFINKDMFLQVLAEAMCLDVPILVNRNIVGGWKYVADETGEEFSTATEFVEALRRLRDPVRKARLKPREWYM